MGVAATFVVTLVALLGFFLAYLWLFESRSCEWRGEIACMLNANQGVVTAFALLVAASAVWVSVLITESGRARIRKESEEAGRESLVSAVDETVHNLVHIAQVSRDEGTLFREPQLSIWAVTDLIRGRSVFVAADVNKRADGLCRNYDRFIHATRSGPSLLDHDEDEFERYLEFIWRHGLSQFVVSSLGLLLRARQKHPEWAGEVLSRPGLQDFTAVIDAGAGWRVTSRSSEISDDDAADMRNRSVPLVAWIDDQPVTDVQTFAELRRFKDLDRTPRRRT